MSREQLSVIDPVLIDLDKKESGGTGPHQPMSLRVHMSSPFVSQPYSSSHARLVDVRELDNRRGLHSPPPIATLDSPSPSVADRSSTTTPHQRRTPPLAQPYYPNQQELIPSSAPRQPPAHFSSRQDPINQYYPFDHHRFEQHHDSHRYNVPSHFVHHQQMHEPYGRPQYPVQPSQPPPVTIVHTDDASTKLTDGIRRRCFNCCTTDTSTWRRSNLSPGKVLCNKCGLFERTHSRPRPDQFPHKRGPLATQSLRGRTPPGIANGTTSSHAHSAHNGSTQLPPIVGYQYHHANLNPLGGQDGYPAQQAAPGPAPQQPLPGLQSWHNTSGSSAASAPNGSAPSSVHSHGPDAPASGANSANTSAHGTPLLPSRRPTMDSPRMQGQPSSASVPSATSDAAPRSNGNGRYDDGLSSNAATKKEKDGGASPRTNGSAPGSTTKSEPSPERE